MGIVITLITDMGFTDAYVGAMKGVILGINPEAKIVDISHSIEPQNIQQAAFVLSTAYEFFPPGTIHLVVVDPGVGTGRRAIILKTPEACFVAPDNGVLSYVIKSHAVSDNPHQIKLNPEYEAFSITRSRFWRSPVSPTFHGRDIFAPIAAHLSLGLPASDFGERVESATVIPMARPRAEGNTLTGNVIHIDVFGNLITNIRQSDLPETRGFIKIEFKKYVISGLVHTYAEGEDLVALIGSSGYLEIAQKNGNASASLNARTGDEVKLILGGTLC